MHVIIEEFGQMGIAIFLGGNVIKILMEVLEMVTSF